MAKQLFPPYSLALPKFGDFCHAYRWMLLLACWCFSDVALGDPIHIQFGFLDDIPAPADYDGDGKADPAVFRPSTGEWLIEGSRSGLMSVNFGTTFQTDFSLQDFRDLTVAPIPADYDGDGKADPAVFDRRTGQWLIDGSRSGPMTISFGERNDDLAAPADYDGDGKADLAVFRPSTDQWFIERSSSGLMILNFGDELSFDTVPIPADYDGDGKTDPALFDSITGQWFIDGSKYGMNITTFDPPGDLPVPADYNGDGAADLAVFNPSGEWSILPSPLVTAVPEPRSWFLLTLGALSLALGLVGRKGLPGFALRWHTGLPLT